MNVRLGEFQPADIEPDDDTEDEAGELVLFFTAEGNCVLEEDGEMVWTSDDDDMFAETFSDDFLEAETDAADVLDYLVDSDWLEESEKPTVIIETELNVDSAANDDDDEDE